ncbi:hypothetical protein [Demequina sp. SO4-18]|uniref:hypothetical protein n=1 Tax=Demequina sp. SO4-18 TaxID=3401026 RepID=UPI003B58DCB5
MAVDKVYARARTQGYRVAYLEDPGAHALGFARHLNAEAIRTWPDRDAPRIFDEATRVLQSAAGAEEVDARVLRDLALILHNAAQLRTFEAMTYLDELPQALDNAREAAALQSELVGLARESPLPQAQAQVPDLVEGLLVMLLTLARVLAACGVLDESQDALAEASALTDEFEQDADWLKWLRLVRRELAPVGDVSGERPERKLWLWLA